MRIPVRAASLVPLLLASLLLPLSASPALGQDAAPERQVPGRIAGRVIDAETGRPVVAAEITIEGTSLRAVTDAQGRYRSPALPGGTYTLTVTSLGYAVTQRTEVLVEPGRTATVTIAMRGEALALEGLSIEVEAAGNASSEAGLLRIQQAAPAVVDGISAEQIGRAPDSDAGDAIARVTGVSVVDNKFVVVRGLGERYSNTLLNGTELASPEPTKRVVPLDIFPASLLESIVTSKTATPDKPGDFAGGSVEIKTKEFPEERVFQVSFSQQYNSYATFDEIPFFQQRGTDYLGFDGRGRELDGEVEGTERFFESLRNEWVPQARRVLPNAGFGIDFGDQVGEFERAIGYVLSFDWGRNTAFAPNQYFAFLNSSGSPQIESRQQASTVTTDWGGVANLSFRLGTNNTLSFKNLMTREAEEFVTAGEERDRETQEGFTPNLTFNQVRYVTRTFMQSQIVGTHRLPFLFGSSVEWLASVSAARRDEPENRTIVYLQPTGSAARIPDPSENNDFWFRFLEDDTYSGKLDWKIPLSLRRQADALFKFGGFARFRNRDFRASLWSVRPPLNGPPDGIDAIALPPEELFSPENIGRNMLINRIPTAGLPYTAQDDLLAGYVMADANIVGGLRLVGGVRAEQWDLVMGPGETAAVRSVLDILPSANLTIPVADEMNLRAAYYRTVSRPDPRELALSPYAPVAGQCTSFGNPDLERVAITNADLRWEWYPSGREIFAVSGFYKRFTDPIIQAVRQESLTCIFFPANAESADNFGAELEFRKTLGFFGEAFEPFLLGANVTWVDGAVTPDPAIFFDLGELPLQDQSRVLVNGSLGYDNEDSGFSASLLVNYFDDRVRRYGTFQTITTDGGDPIQTRRPDIIEQGRTTLDAKVRKRFENGLTVSLSGNNLTGQDILEYSETAAGRIPAGTGFIGTSVSLSVAYAR